VKILILAMIMGAAATAAAADPQLPETWSPVTLPRQDNVQWTIVTREVPFHYEATKINAKTGDFLRVDVSTTIRYWQPYDPANILGVEEKAAHHRGCPTGMVRVQGTMKDWKIVQDMQNAACAEGPDHGKPWNPQYLCYKFDPKKFNYDERRKNALKAGRKLQEQDLDFCMDQFEYPNQRGGYPAIMINWFNARAICEADGKRLCTENEWTFACEGPEALPYPTGYVKDPTACNFDRIRKSAMNESTVTQFDTPAAQKMIAGLFGGSPSGSFERCVSPFGVYDLTGNVDEWTKYEAPGRPRDMAAGGGKGLLSILKGGFWGPVRNRCQPSTSSHGPDFRFYQQGFRCCSSVSPE
jgi:formylglycine-generating enzyme required for sulfatase activity